MTIYDYFKEYNDAYYNMKDKLIELKEAEKNFISLTGTKPSEYPRNTSNGNFGFADQLARIEKIIVDYKKLEKDYLKERDKCVTAINKVNKHKHRTILMLFFIERKNIKEISNVLSRTYKLYYTIDYIKKLKSIAIREFEKVTFFHEK